MAKANALKAELGIPPDMPAAAAISAACEVMQIIREQGESLPDLADRVVAAVGCVVDGACSRCGCGSGSGSACSCCARTRCGSSSRCGGFGGGFGGGRVSCSRKAQARYLLFEDNLDAQCQPEYLQVLCDTGGVGGEGAWWL